MLIVSHTSTLDEAHSWTLACSLVKRMLTISHTSTFHGACEISKHPSARTTSLCSFYLRFSFSIVRLHFFRHTVLSRMINSQARRVNVTANTTRSQSTFFSARFGRGRLGGRCYNLKLLYMQALDDLDLTFSVIYCNILVMNLGELENIIIYSHTYYNYASFTFVYH